MSKQKERWYCDIEFTFDVDTEPSKPRFAGDAEVDFARRSFEEGLLNRLNKSFPGNDGINWCLKGQPKRVGIWKQREADDD